jgi:two-component system LytT family response regulator
VLIIDDDASAAALLRYRLSCLPTIEVCGEARSVGEARMLLARRNYDLVFLDVDLGPENGFSLLPLVDAAARVIVVSGHEHHAARAFELDVLDYMVKPVTPQRLDTALQRFALRQAVPPPQAFSLDDKFFLKGTSGAGRFVFVREIHAIVSSENYSDVLLSNGERSLMRRTMRAWLALLPPEAFVRIHRTAIVNLHGIERIERNAEDSGLVWLRGLAQPLAVSRRLWPAFRQRAERVAPLQCKSLDRHAGSTARHRDLAADSQEA